MELAAATQPSSTMDTSIIFTMATFITRARVEKSKSTLYQSVTQTPNPALRDMPAAGTIQSTFMAPAVDTKRFLTGITSTISLTVICITRTATIAMIMDRSLWFRPSLESRDLLCLV